jgi:hypothetical protein
MSKIETENTPSNEMQKQLKEDEKEEIFAENHSES